MITGYRLEVSTLNPDVPQLYNIEARLLPVAVLLGSTAVVQAAELPQCLLPSPCRSSAASPGPALFKQLPVFLQIRAFILSFISCTTLVQ